MIKINGKKCTKIVIYPIESGRSWQNPKNKSGEARNFAG